MLIKTKTNRARVKSKISTDSVIGAILSVPKKRLGAIAAIVSLIGISSVIYSSAAAPAPVISLQSTTQTEIVTPKTSPATTTVKPPTAIPPKSSPKQTASAPANTDFTTFWLEPNRTPKLEANRIRATRPADAALLDKIGDTPVTVWVGGFYGEENLLKVAVAGSKATKTIMALSVYGIPFRDGGSYSSGGFADFASYAQWIERTAATVGDAHTYIIIETDAVAMDIPDEKAPERYQSLNYAVSKLGSLPNARVYLDGGTAGWQTPDTMASRMKRAGIANADGFAVNVANFKTTQESVAYGRQIASKIGNKPFIIDTSRNGNGAWEPTNGETENWCNPPGRALGERPTTKTGIAGVDAFIWVKGPGGSDGACRGYPKAADWIESQALEMARNAKW